MIDVEELERLEKARTQGEWYIDDNEGYGVTRIVQTCPAGQQRGRSIAHVIGDDAQVEEDAAFLAFLANNASSILSELKRGREYKKALEEIAGRTPDGTHSLDRQLAPDAVRINEIARTALQDQTNG